LGSQNVDFLATWAEIINKPISKQITFNRGDLCTTGFYKLPGLPQRSQIKTNIKQASSNIAKEFEMQQKQ
jgi:hypothetical protein